MNQWTWLGGCVRKSKAREDELGKQTSRTDKFHVRKRIRRLARTSLWIVHQAVADNKDESRAFQLSIEAVKSPPRCKVKTNLLVVIQKGLLEAQEGVSIHRAKTDGFNGQ